ncbi:MAG: hypothetical protein M1830_006990 [Pleopsidium flavum]|nr:MAG: hypothetical protein M1830_006990 [Pleopsidium flavum]
MLALFTLIHLFAAAIAVPHNAICNHVTNPSLNFRDCSAAVSLIPDSAVGGDIVHLGTHGPFSRFTAGGDPDSPINLPRYFTADECQVTVTMRNGFTSYYAVWAELRLAATIVLHGCVAGVPGLLDGGPPGRGGNATYGRIEVRIAAPANVTQIKFVGHREWRNAEGRPHSILWVAVDGK